MNITVLDAYAANPGDFSWGEFEKLGNLTVYDRTPEKLIVERCIDADAVILNKVTMSRETLSRLPKLKYIGMLATGYNVVDTEAAKEFGIIVCNVPTYSTYAVAQLTFAHILELFNQVGVHNTAVHNGEWRSCLDYCFWKTPLIELSGKTIGIIGLGKIGTEVARIADAFHMNILCYVPREKPMPSFSSFRFVGLDELAEKSDIVTLHCPLTTETKGMINEAFISKMKSSAVIVNTSRGPIIDEQALADALNAGKIRGAGIDVISVEPPVNGNPLLDCKNCILTPHIAWAGYETRERLLGVVLENLKAFINGNPINVVNP